MRNGLGMVYLVGVDHLVQYNGPVPEQLRLEFKGFIIDTSRMLFINLIAEEFSKEALEQVYSATEATARDAARILGIEHRYCDPEEPELRSMGVPYYAEVKELVRRKYAIPDAFILDENIRKKIERETAEIIRSYWHLREKFWYDRIQDVLDLNVLFICGHEHVDRFYELLRSEGCGCDIINAFWKSEIFSDYNKLNLA